MKKLFILFAFVITCTSIIAQNDTIKPVLIIDDPLAAPKFDIYLAPINMGFYGINPVSLTGGAGFNARFINNLIELGGSFEISYTKKNFMNIFSTDKAINDGYSHPGNPSIKIQQDFKRFFTYDVGIKIKVKDQTKRQEVEIALRSDKVGSHYDGRTQTNFYLVKVFKTEANLRRILKVRAGYKYLASRFTIIGTKYRTADSGDEFCYDAVKYTNVKYSGYHDKSLIQGGDNSYRDFESNITVHAIYLGFESEKIINVLYRTPFGIRGIQKRASYFLDLMFAPSISVDKVKFFKSDTTISPDYDFGYAIKEYNFIGKGSGQYKTSPFGFRFGFKVNGISKSKIAKFEDKNPSTHLFSMGYKFECGLLPGVLWKNWYVTLGFYWPLLNI